MRRLITAARELFAERPIYTRRALFNSLPEEDLAIIGSNARKHIQQFVGYVFDGGPWSKAIIRFGIDPRKDKGLRLYQTMTFQLDEPAQRRNKHEGNGPKQAGAAEKDLSQPADSHLFDGTRAYTEGKVWQVCDITDPLLASLLATEELREDCHLEYDGWFNNATLAKVKVIMRQKLLKIQRGEEIDDSLFDKVLTLPEVYDSTTASRFWNKNWDRKELGKEEGRLLEMVRMVATRTAGGPIQPAKDSEARNPSQDIDRTKDGDDCPEDEENSNGSRALQQATPSGDGDS